MTMQASLHIETRLYRMRRVGQYVKGRLDNTVYFVRATSEKQAHEEMAQRFFNDDSFSCLVTA